MIYERRSKGMVTPERHPLRSSAAGLLLVVAAWLLATPILVAGCTLLLRPARESFGDGDADADQAGDSAPPDADAEAERDADLEAERDTEAEAEADVADHDGELDAELPPDAEVDRDADEVEAGPCVADSGEGLIALFELNGSFASSTLEESWVSPVVDHACRSFGAGPPYAGCGQALYFNNCSGGSWLELANEDAWDEIAALDFWFMPLGTPPGGEEGPSQWGILSRDAAYQSFPGHFYLALEQDLRLQLRTQDGSVAFLCSDEALTLDRWHHVEVRFGEPRLELLVDGAPQRSCEGSAPVTHDLSGNDEPWVLGALNAGSGDGVATPVRDRLGFGAIDHLRFWRVRPE